MLLRAMALLSCALFSGCATDVHSSLVEMQSPDPESVREAVVHLGTLLSEKEEAGYPYDEGDEAAIRLLREVAEKGKDPVQRAAAVDGLSRLRRPDLIELCLKAIEDSSWIVQMEAVKALRRRVDPRAVEPLKKRLEDDIRPEVRLEVLKTLVAIGGEEPLRTLLTIFIDAPAPYEDMRLAVYDGVRSLSGESILFEDKEGWKKFFERRFGGGGAPKTAEKTASLGTSPQPPSSAKSPETKEE